MVATTRSVFVLLLAVVLVLPGSAGAQGAGPSFRGDDRLVLALYYPWYDEHTWTSGLTADVPLLPYASWEREAIDRHAGWAQDAGIASTFRAAVATNPS